MDPESFYALTDRINAVVNDEQLAAQFAVEIGDTPVIEDDKVIVTLDGKTHELPLSVLGE